MIFLLPIHFNVEIFHEKTLNIFHHPLNVHISIENKVLETHLIVVEIDVWTKMAD